MRKNTKTKTPDFERAFQKSLDLLAGGEGIKKTLSQIGRSYPAEVESCMANLVRVLAMLDGNAPLGSFRFSFLRPEGGGI